MKKVVQKPAYMQAPKKMPINRPKVKPEYLEAYKAKKIPVPPGCFDVSKYKCWMTG